MALSIQLATLISLLVQSILYGIFCMLFIASTYVLKQRQKAHVSISRPIAVAGPIMFVLASAHIATIFVRIVQAFIREPDKTGQQAVLNATSSVSYVIKTTLYMAQTVWVGDGFMVYRLHIVWNGDKRVMIPMYIALVASMATSIASLHACATDVVIDVFGLQKWGYATYSMTLGVNFSGTSLIAARIMWNEKNVRRITVQGQSTLAAALVIIESGAIYSLGTIVLLIFFRSGNYIHYVFGEALVQVVGIVFSMIILRIGLGMSFQDTYSTTLTRNPTGRPSGVGHPLSQSLTVPSPALAINVSKVTHTHSDRGYTKDHRLAASDEALQLS
ncbi:hypothetical protein CONPUDRAFT_91325 [Coniophora puteana RWD-64-598 SS2]|uniref:Uncharacterized protein n=1 Tax=Coniophora puteana (strain RWD-64-598) TaxID=741705 RepID=A0A5M3MI70_CONPW|nr:uncharacterized protein CONPUDRAFT_91325 [Coniophora puteana RWD-64-598 SS2]EIW78939.1 hypothetical protein CONPUDRAFT_91325 [Coniophora puteana RWD-64-598 SS2]